MDAKVAALETSNQALQSVMAQEVAKAQGDAETIRTAYKEVAQTEVDKLRSGLKTAVNDTRTQLRELYELRNWIDLLVGVCGVVFLVNYVIMPFGSWLGRLFHH